MSHIHSADVHVEFFTPPEFPVEILNEAKGKDVIPCCLTPNAKQFVAFMLLKEYYYRCDGILVFIQEDTRPPVNLDSSLDSEFSDSDLQSQEQDKEQSPKPEPEVPPCCDPPLETLSSILVIDLRDKFTDILNRKRLKQIIDGEIASAVIICSRKDFISFTKPCSIDATSNILSRLRLIIMDNVHEALKDSLVKSEVLDILNIVKQCNERQVSQMQPRIGMVYLTVSLLHYYGYESNGFWRMEETFRKLEQLCQAKVDTSSDIVALLRYSAPLTERIISHSPGLSSDVSQLVTSQVKQIIEELKTFLNEYHFNPVQELGYNDDEWQEMLRVRKEKELAKSVNEEETVENAEDDDTGSLFEEVGRIQSPCTAPLLLIQQFETILDLFGPWCANRALYLLINQIGKMKTRVPYVRHYLLLGLLHSRFVLVQATFQAKFDEFEPLEVLEKFSTPKLLSVLNILRRFNLTTVHEGKLIRQQQELLQRKQEDYDDEMEVTVAEYLKHQQLQQQEQPTSRLRGGRSGGRRKGGRMQAAKQKTNKVVTFDEEPTTMNVVGDQKSETAEKTSESISTDKTEDEVANALALGNKKDEPSKTQVQESPLEKGIGNNIAPEQTIIPAVDVKNKEKPEPDSPAPASQGESSQITRKYQRRNRNYKANEDALCGIILLEDRFHARLLYHFLREAADVDVKLIGLSPTIALCSNIEYDKDSREAEIEYKRREENLRKFRYREANFLVGTSLLEDGIELPKANLVIRFDESKSFRSYLFSKGRAQGMDAEYYVFTDEQNISSCLKQLATYKTVEETLLSHTVIPKPSYETPASSASVASLNLLQLNIPVFKTAALSTAISIVNRYCARLPSDTFTRLTPSWSTNMTKLVEVKPKYFVSDTGFSCSLRLPINSPVKWPIKGVPMPTQPLAKKAVALQTVMVLHKNGELDDELLPVGKEGVVQEADLEVSSESIEEDFDEFRPGSTRRRQYYDKQLASEMIDCLPEVGRPFYLYWLRMTLVCPLPDEQNTRGRKLHPPEDATQCFGIALSKSIPPLPPFPIYTRCGEVLVEMVRIYDEENLHELTAERLEKISTFHHYAFTSVLRLDKYLTLFDPNLSENSYYVVPLKSRGKSVKDGSVQIDWDFIDVISHEKDVAHPVPQDDESRKNYEFLKEQYVDAVVMPWYRNNDQPQYFYVAEICNNLTPRSQFPGCEFKTFEEYYRKKYRLVIQHPSQPLLDVDHTSARLNFLTPRYVNRKGMALPTSSETTKKAKRENLEQKQILVPELCAIHPFTASLWRQAVCLPCILYRVNALLMANNIRTLVASQVHGLGLVNLSEDYKWNALSFGWSLSDVFSSSTEPKNMIKDKQVDQSADTKVEGKDSKTNVKENSVPESKQPSDSKSSEPSKPADTKREKSAEAPKISGFEKAAKEEVPKNVVFGQNLLGNKTLNEILSEEMKKCRQPQLEIGTWSNEMASGTTASEPDYDEEEDELLDPNVALPSNLMMLDQKVSWGGRYKLFNHKVHRALYGSPTHWGEVWDRTAFEPPEDFDDLETASLHSDMSGSDESFLDGDNNLKIQFEGNTAEALDKRKFGTAFDHRLTDEFRASEDLWWGQPEDGEETGDFHERNEDVLKQEFEKKVEARIGDIQNVFMWNEVQNIPPRALKKTSGIEDKPNEITKECVDLITSAAPLRPPPMVRSPEKCLDTVKYEMKPDPASFSFDYQPPLGGHVGPSPCQILQALTMSNANDGLNLERLETIGDSFLKYAITTYLFCTYENIHEGKLSHLRSKQVSNVHLYRLGRRRGLGGIMIAAKFEPHDNWLPPCYHISKDLDKALIHSKLPHNHFSMAQVTAMKGMTKSEIEEALKSSTVKLDSDFIPYNLVTQQSIPDKSIADSVEALIGAYLTSTGPLGALLFMSWLGLRVLPSRVIPTHELLELKSKCQPNSTPLYYMKVPDKSELILFENLKPPASPLLRYEGDCARQLGVLLKGYERFEQSINYKFRDRGYLLQAFTHASYAANTLTDCYQRLEFLGDAILDYLITRHLYEDPRQHSPGSLTDLRSALVNNTIFASLAVKNGFHKYFRHASPGLSTVLQKFVTFQEQHSHTLTQDYYLMGEEECEEAEDIEVPKALGDVFESVAGAIYLDSGMSLDAVWSVYYKIMKNEIEQFSQNVPKSPIRELLELEPETAKFGKPEKLWDGRRVRVVVEIFGVGVFRGIGRNYRIAKCTAAKCALRHVRKYRHRT